MELTKIWTFNDNHLKLVMLHSSSNVEEIDYRLAYSPQNEILDRIMAGAAESLNISTISFPNGQAMEFSLRSRNILTGVEFDDSLTVWCHFTDLLIIPVHPCRTSRMQPACRRRSATLFVSPENFAYLVDWSQTGQPVYWWNRTRHGHVVVFRTTEDLPAISRRTSSLFKRRSRGPSSGNVILGRVCLRCSFR